MNFTVTGSNIFLFDVDGTLTESRKKISLKMRSSIDAHQTRMTQNSRENDQFYYYLVTGSNYEKTREQIGDQFLNWNVNGVFACSGNEFWVAGKRITFNTWQPDNNVINWLQSQLAKSKYPDKIGNFIELRPGSLNFSVVGRLAIGAQRRHYFEYDQQTNERAKIAAAFNKKFPHLRATVGGETGIDITQLGFDKSQVYRMIAPLAYALNDTTIWFFGDKMNNGGNDQPLADMLTACYPYSIKIPVSSPEETRGILDKMVYKND